MPKSPHGLRATVLLYGTVVEQDVAWQSRSGAGGSWSVLPGCIPTPDGESLGRFRWGTDGLLEVEVSTGELRSAGHQAWVWDNGAGIELRLDRIEMQRARRTSGNGWGDVALLVMMLTMFVGLAQLNYLFRAYVGPAVAETSDHGPSPELIARLLQREFDGADRGQIERVQRRAHPRPSHSIYLPAGSDGPATRMGGGATASAEPYRTPPTLTDGSGVPDRGDDVVPEVAPQVSIDPAAAGKRLAARDTRRPGSVRPGLRRSVEEFVGWGLPDWIDGVGPTSADFQEQVRLVTELVKIDPDHPYVMAVVGNLSYLSEDYVLSEEIYRRFVRLHPEQAAGWNNLALIYKRRGQYGEEERLYRRALSLDPGSPSSQINLAVNLAHQGRFAEAESLMEQLKPDKSRRAYANLHRAKIAAAQGQDRRAFRLLKKALAEVKGLDTMLHIEFRQDLRLEPSFAALRKTRRFNRLIEQTYGSDPGGLLGSTGARVDGGTSG